MSHYESIRRVIERVRRRWRTVQALDAMWRAALACVVVVGAGLFAALWTNGAPALLAVIAIVTLVFTLAAVGWALLPLRRTPGDRQVARFIEARATLDDRLVTAVDAAERAPAQGSPLLEPMLADAARRVGQL